MRRGAKVLRLVAKSDGLNAEMREWFSLVQRLDQGQQLMVITLIEVCAKSSGLLPIRKPKSNIGKPVVDLTGDDRQGA